MPSMTLTDGQTLYWEESGDGVPALYLHGGPGGTLGTGRYRSYFDLAPCRVVAFEQRGCGRSTPLATDPGHDLDANTTPRLISDIEELRERLGIDSWVVTGVSWGSTLALAYARTHPARVRGVALMAVTSTSRFEVDWITETVGALYPEGWDRFAAFAETAGIGYRRGESRLVDAYALLMRDPDPGVRAAAAEAWAEWEDTHVAIGAGGFRRDPRWSDPLFTENFVTLATHYWSHDGFCDPPLLETMDALSGIPGVLIHGRRDVSSPLATAWELHRRWPDSRLVVDEGEGHGGRSMGEELATAIADLVTEVD